MAPAVILRETGPPSVLKLEEKEQTPRSTSEVGDCASNCNICVVLAHYLFHRSSVTGVSGALDVVHIEVETSHQLSNKYLYTSESFLWLLRHGMSRKVLTMSVCLFTVVTWDFTLYHTWSNARGSSLF